MAGDRDLLKVTYEKIDIQYIGKYVGRYSQSMYKNRVENDRIFF